MLGKRHAEPCHYPHLFTGCISIFTVAPKPLEIWGFEIGSLQAAGFATNRLGCFRRKASCGPIGVFCKYLFINIMYHQFFSTTAIKDVGNDKHAEHLLDRATTVADS